MLSNSFLLITPFYHDFVLGGGEGLVHWWELSHSNNYNRKVG